MKPTIMKKMLTLICAGVLMSALGAAVTACNNEPDEPGQNEEPTGNEQNEEQQREDVPFAEYSFGEGSTARWVNFGSGYDGQSKLLVINSDEELIKYVEGDYPEIDFTKKTLLLASGTAPNGLSNKIVQSLQQLSAGKYKCSVEIKLGPTDMMQDWQVAILTDKLSNDSKIELNVTFSY
ncbi:MAG: hypothetical protein LBU98_02030 [Alistipes sp.]|jgi:hypothetical protein|nr:hypothetical protein [Alistipes sp.]